MKTLSAKYSKPTQVHHKATVRVLSNLPVIIIIKTLFTLGLERKIYKNEMITAKDKRVIHSSRSRTSHLQAILRETSNPKNANASNRKRRKLTYLYCGFKTVLTDQVQANNHKYKI